jgi:mRNA-degrading endonuclease HigB of HigAB toxin-antitoxin module
VRSGVRGIGGTIGMISFMKLSEIKEPQRTPGNRNIFLTKKKTHTTMHRVYHSSSSAGGSAGGSSVLRDAKGRFKSSRTTSGGGNAKNNNNNTTKNTNNNTKNTQAWYSYDETCDGKDIPTVWTSIADKTAFCADAKPYVLGAPGHAAGPDKGDRLTKAQVAGLREVMQKHFGSELELSLAALAAAKVAVGRWLRPSEVKGVFGADTTVLRQKLVVSTDGKMDPSDARIIAYLSGKRGMAAQSLTRRSGCLYIWFTQGKSALVAEVFATERAHLNRARLMLAKMCEGFRVGDPEDPAHGVKLKILAPNKKGYAVQTVELKKMYKN